MHKPRAQLSQLEAIVFDVLTAAIVLPLVIIPAVVAAAVDLFARLVRRVRAA
ncbi:MAG: hypothetical protein ABI534_08085 [Chloroflexota bacterium]